MVNIDEIIERKPHLKDTLGLYEKIVKFVGTVNGLLLLNRERNPISVENIDYPPELIDHIFETFSSTFHIPEDNLLPLKEVMKRGQVDLTKLPLNEAPSSSLPYERDELFTILFLIGKPYFQCMRGSSKIDHTFWEEGRCPICNSMPSMASIDRDGRKHFYCSFCEAVGYYRRTGCPSCLNDDLSKMNIITAEGEDGFRIYACEVCGYYYKTIEFGLLDDLNPSLADLISLPLDIVAQGKGYKRHSPNPIGMVRMV